MGYHVESGRTDLIYRPLEANDWETVHEEIKVKPMQDTCGWVAMSQEGITLGIMVYDNWNDTSCHIHHYLKEPFICTMGWLEYAFGFPFQWENVQNLWGMVPEDNERAVNGNLHVGFEHVVFIPDYWKEGKGQYVMKMTRDTWRERWAAAEAT